MIAYLLSSLREWRRARMSRSVGYSAALLAAAALAGPLQPLLLALAGVAVFALSGWAEGNSPGSKGGEGLDPAAFPAGTWAVVAGRLLSALAVWLALLLAFSPLFAASAIAWGLSREVMLSCLACWLCAFLLAASAGFCSKLLFPGSEGLIGLCVFLLWLFSSFFAERLRASNPFVQAWSLLKLEGGKVEAAGLLADAAGAAALLAASALAISRRRRQRDA